MLAVVLGLLGAAAYLALQSVYFIGTNDRGLVTLFQGVPYELPGNLALYSSQLRLGRERRRRSPRSAGSTLLDHSLRSEADAASLIRSLELGTARMRRAAVNRPIVRLYGLVALLFALLVAFTSRWTIFEASSLRDNTLNARTLLEQQRIDARADPRRRRHRARAQRARRRRRLPAHLPARANCSPTPVGYYYIEPDLGSTGIERYRNASSTASSGTNLQSVLDSAAGQEAAGRQGRHDARPDAQRVANVGARRPRRRRRGARTAHRRGDGDGLHARLRPERAALAASAYAAPHSATPRAARSSTARPSSATRPARPSRSSPPRPRSTPAPTRPNRPSAAATACSSRACRCRTTNNESFGQITLTEALVHSVNTVWAQVAEQLGKPTMARYMTRFGFDRKPQLDYPAEEMSTSGEYSARTADLARSARRSTSGAWASARTNSRSCPLQMAEVAAAVANDGVLMVPHLTQPDRRLRRPHRADGRAARAVDA